jgi:hypothetical protein
MIRFQSGSNIYLPVQFLDATFTEHMLIIILRIRKLNFHKHAKNKLSDKTGLKVHVLNCSLKQSIS